MEVELELNSIELLNEDLLSHKEKLNEISYWLKVMNRPQGWHYDMDIIWLLKGLKEAGIEKGATILDAGAGMGITQFILAARGYDVISLDFSPRSNPPLAQEIFEIEVTEQDNLDYKHDYIGFVKYDSNICEEEKYKDPRLYQKIWNVMGRGPGYMLSRIKQQFQKIQNNQFNKSEKRGNHSGFGKIKFIRAAFHEIPLNSEIVDALVSVSALEHADPMLMGKNINEMKRVVKKGNPILITTSATKKEKDCFHDKTQGWCFSKDTLATIIGKELPIEFDPDLAEKRILSSKIWRTRIDPYYANDPESGFYQRKTQSLPYIPVGIKLIRE
jgi:ubiquinone/menaquinone biosynthesis C-methylase UbiE